MRRGSVELQFAEDGRQKAVLEAFFERVAPDKPREEMVESLLENRLVHGAFVQSKRYVYMQAIDRSRTMIAGA